MSANSCTKGNDSPCKTLYPQSADACCTYIKLEEVPDPLTADESAALALLAAVGYPSKKGDVTHACAPSAAEIKASVDKDEKVSKNGFTFKIYCDASTMLVASAKALAITAVLASF